MTCPDCGTEDSGAPSYKPACLIERDHLRAQLAEVEAERERWAKWAVLAAEVAPLRARVASLIVAVRCLEWAFDGECAECGAFRMGDDPQDKVHRPGCQIAAALDD